VFLDARTAREVALRDGTIHWIATGRIDRLGSRYALSVAVDEAVGGAPVAQASVEVTDIDTMLDGVRSLAAAVRAAVGESRGRVASDARLARVTTRSLDALVDYTAGLALVDQRRWAAAELRLAEAVRRDPFFASALIMLAHSQRNQAPMAGHWMPVAEQAFHLAAGLPARERYFIEGSYHQMKMDLPRAIAAYEALLDEQPNDFWGQNNLAHAYRETGRFREDLQLSKRLVSQRPLDAATLVNYASSLVINGQGVSDALKLAARASTLERPPGTPGATGGAWIELLPTFAAWAEGRVTDAAALLDRVSGVAPVSEWHVFARGQMNLTLGRVEAAERAFQLMPEPAERELLLGYAALARGDTAGARARLARAAPAWTESLRARGPVRVVTPCWALLRAGLSDECRQASGLWLDERPAWLVGELASADGDDDTALRMLQGVLVSVPPGEHQYGLAIDAIARQFERRGDIPGAVDMLRRLDGVHRTVYPRPGVHGFTWLLARTHLLDLERQLGRTDRVAALVQELEGRVAVADPDFVVRAALR
jgi:tetratricopeptide (TPR) repeat protein